MGNIITPTPKSPCVPHIWRYDSIRARLLEASGLITAKEAERRVLILENPGMRGQSKITTSLYCGSTGDAGRKSPRPTIYRL